MRLPRPLRFALWFVIGFVLTLLVVRAGFWVYFRQGQSALDGSALLQSFVLGARFDLRLGLIVLLPFLLLAPFPWLSPWNGLWQRRVWQAYFALVLAALVLVYMIDFGHFAYLQQKLNASVLMFAKDAAISAEMVWSTYPVVRLVLVLLALAMAGGWLVSRIIDRVFESAAYPGGKWRTALWAVVGFLLVVLGIHGRFSQYPLRWSDAYFNPNPFAPAVTLNPVLNFFDTLKYAKSSLDMGRVRAAYPRMAAYLGVSAPDVGKLNYSRLVEPKPTALPGQPNVVMVYVESFSGYKTSLFGNKLNSTPYFDSLARDGVLFDHFYTPHAGTARGVFCGLTGIPDVELGDTSSRNPASVNQHLIINEFKGYEKFYFIGGSTTWANIRGLLTNNIEGLHLYEEGSYASPRNDVWGISDTNLFLEANQVLRQQTKPFFAVIQTAGNHRPYTIPAEDKDFVVLNPTDEELHANGFISRFEYNSFRYMDYSIRRFMEQARKEPYFNNTVFAFFGDHGITGFAGRHMPKSYTDLKFSAVHTPFLIYAPKLLKPARYSKVGSQVDVMPTLAGLFNMRYVNSTLGRDLLDDRFDQNRMAFVIYHSPEPEIGLLQSPYYVTQRGTKGIPSLHEVASNDPLQDLSAAHPTETQQLQQWLLDYYWTARYMLINNHKPNKP